MLFPWVQPSNYNAHENILVKNSLDLPLAGIKEGVLFVPYCERFIWQTLGHSL